MKTWEIKLDFEEKIEIEADHMTLHDDDVFVFVKDTGDVQHTVAVVPRIRVVWAREKVAVDV
ncbi:MAG TPA: hypothetical protein VFI41_04895 [Gemmatimonadales bacterium]|nr:hypothetical protein [Gemmatimonadales bacterium]